MIREGFLYLLDLLDPLVLVPSSTNAISGDLGFRTTVSIYDSGGDEGEFLVSNEGVEILSELPPLIYYLLLANGDTKNPIYGQPLSTNSISLPNGSNSHLEGGSVLIDGVEATVDVGSSTDSLLVVNEPVVVVDGNEKKIVSNNGMVLDITQMSLTNVENFLNNNAKFFIDILI